jgi:lambda family phage minor tail protein L
MTLEADVQQGWHDAIVEMFDVDLSPITSDPGDIFYFTNQLKEDGTKIQWKGNIYEPLPILAAGYDKNTNGQIAQPTLTVANVLGTFTQVVASFDDLVGAKVTRRRTLQKYLDGSPQADPLQEFPIDIFYIERKTQETALAITWQLSSILDLEGVKLPRRVITQNLCLWKYRSSECGYTGAPLFDSRDQVISTSGQTAQGLAVINAWRLREQRKAELRNATAVRNQTIGARESACQTFTLLERRFSLLPRNYVLRFFVRGNPAFIGYFNGAVVPINQQYRQGRPGPFFFGGLVYEIELWGVNAAACTAATNTLAGAEANLTTAQNNLNSAEAALSAAVAALPLNDPLRLADVCGKRVSSCALRFPEQSLPFGGFPGANLTRG